MSGDEWGKFVSGIMSEIATQGSVNSIDAITLIEQWEAAYRLVERGYILPDAPQPDADSRLAEIKARLPEKPFDEWLSAFSSKRLNVTLTNFDTDTVDHLTGREKLFIAHAPADLEWAVDSLETALAEIERLTAKIIKTAAVDRDHVFCHDCDFQIDNCECKSGLSDIFIDTSRYE